MFITQPGNPALAYVADFCRHVAQDQIPIVIPHKPLPGKPQNECFSIIPEQVIAEGGKQLTGWAIWETSGLYIEAEFHTVWQDPQGNLIDLTPRPYHFETILFLPDPRREYRGRQVNNIRRPLVDDLDVTRFLHLATRRFEILNKGDLAEQHGELALPPRVLRDYRKVEKEVMQLQHRLIRRYE